MDYRLNFDAVWRDFDLLLSGLGLAYSRQSRFGEALQAWREAIVRRDGPTMLVLTRQGVPVIRVDEPSLSMTMGINTSPLAGRDGDKRTAPLVQSRLDAELVDAIAATLPGAGWQRCRTHYMRNLLTKVPKSAQAMVATLVRTIFEQPDAASVWAQHARVVDQLAEKFPDAAAHLADAAADGEITEDELKELRREHRGHHRGLGADDGSTDDA